MRFLPPAERLELSLSWLISGATLFALVYWILSLPGFAEPRRANETGLLSVTGRLICNHPNDFFEAESTDPYRR
jgi:hypothetical protein